VIHAQSRLNSLQVGRGHHFYPTASVRLFQGQDAPSPDPRKKSPPHILPHSLTPSAFKLTVSMVHLHFRPGDSSVVCRGCVNLYSCLSPDCILLSKYIMLFSVWLIEPPLQSSSQKGTSSRINSTKRKIWHCQMTSYLELGWYPFKKIRNQFYSVFSKNVSNVCGHI